MCFSITSMILLQESSGQGIGIPVFIGLIICIVLIIVAIRANRKPSNPSTIPTKKETKQEKDEPLQSFTVEVKGTSFRGKKEIEAAKRLKVGDSVKLSHEIDNPKDEYAMAIYDSDGFHIGYVDSLYSKWTYFNKDLISASKVRSIKPWDSAPFIKVDIYFPSGVKAPQNRLDDLVGELGSGKFIEYGVVMPEDRMEKKYPGFKKALANKYTEPEESLKFLLSVGRVEEAIWILHEGLTILRKTKQFKKEIELIDEIIRMIEGFDEEEYSYKDFDLRKYHERRKRALEQWEKNKRMEWTTYQKETLLKPKEEEIKNKDTMFFKKKITITGYFEEFENADELAGMLKTLGADIDSSIGERTDILIIGKEASETTEKKMKKLVREDPANKSIIRREKFLEIFKEIYPGYLE